MVRFSWGALIGLLALSLSPAPSQPPALAKPEPAPTRLDQYGDPLPPGAVARIGSSRFRQHDPIQVLFARDGKTLFSVNGDGALVQWGVGSGRALRSVEKKFCLALSP